MVNQEQLPALVLQLRLWGRHHEEMVAPDLRRARSFWRVTQSPHGGWSVGARVQGRIISDSPVKWTCATNGMAWQHAAAGWWQSEAEASAALELAFKVAYDDEFAMATKAAADQAAGEAVMAAFAPRILAVFARRQAAGIAGYSPWLDTWGWSLGGPKEPYTEEAVARAEANITAEETRLAERAAFLTGVPALFARLVTLGVKTELDYSGNVRLIEVDRWVTPFPMTVAGLEELAAYVADQERRHTVPVKATKLDLSGMFGGAAKVTKK